MQKVKYEAPSNIALVKYWGKFGNQFPRNASVSFTLSNCKSIFEIKLEDKSSREIEVEVSVLYNNFNLFFIIIID